MGINPVPEPTSVQKATAQLEKVQEDFRIIGGGSVSPDARAKLFRDAETRMKALAQDTSIPQNVREGINSVLSEMSKELTPTGAAMLGLQTALIQEQLQSPSAPILGPGIWEPSSAPLFPLGPGIVQPEVNLPPLEPGIVKPSEPEEPLGPGGTEKPR